jgi:CBS domain-containing protein
MKARDIMGSCVISVFPDLPVQAVANTLVKNGISAVPVIDHAGQLLGIISEGDLMRRAEIETERRHSWWLDMFGSSRSRAADFVKAHGRKARDVMTTSVVTASPETPLQQIADLLEKRGIKRVPIVVDGQVVGIVSRANLVQALASGKASSDVASSDERLRDAIVARLQAQPWGNATLNVIVQGGVAELWGVVDNDEEKHAVRIAAGEIPGVVAVKDNVRVYPISAGF